MGGFNNYYFSSVVEFYFALHYYLIDIVFSSMSFQDFSLIPTMADLIDINILLDEIGEEETTDENIEIGEMMDLELLVPTEKSEKCLR